MNRKNLIILAEYLYNLKPDYSHFDMGTYFSGDYYEGLAYSDELEFDYSEFNRELHKCGTVACALGHAPSLADKFPEFKPKLGEDWEEYSDRVFGLDDYSEIRPNIMTRSTNLHDLLPAPGWKWVGEDA